MAMKQLIGVMAVLFILSAAKAEPGTFSNPSLFDYENHRIVVTVPPGNRNVEMPPTGNSKKFLTSVDPDEMKAIQKKYVRALKTLVKDNGKVIRMINRIAPLYDVKPIHVLGAIVGEHTFNVNIIDDAQNYLAWMHSKWIANFTDDRLTITTILEKPEFAECMRERDSYEKWNCIGYHWEKDFRNQTKYGVKYDDKGFIMQWFNPMKAGTTYGLGQMSPLRVLFATDIVHERGGLPVLDENHAGDVYKAVLDPETTIHYIAANVSISIREYHRIAGFDISDNPGITATLYNRGGEKGLALKLFKSNKARLAKGEDILLPAENHYGWWINDRRAQLEEILAKFP